MKRFAVIGPGAVGTVITNELRKTNHHVKLFGRRELQITLKNLNHQQTELRCSNLFFNTETFDYIFVAVKATSLHLIADDIKKMMHANSVVILCQNGMGQLLDTPIKNAYQAVVYISGQKHKNTVMHFRDKKLILPNIPIFKDLLDITNSTELNIELTTAHLESLWFKLLVNLGINTMTALSNNTSLIFQDQQVKDLTEHLLLEGITVAHKEGLHFKETTVQDIMAIYESYPPEMGTSMYYDMKAGQKTEYQYIQGYINQCAKKHCLKTPILDVCSTLLYAYNINK